MEDKSQKKQGAPRCTECRIGVMKQRYYITAGGNGYVILECTWCHRQDTYSRRESWHGF